MVNEEEGRITWCLSHKQLEDRMKALEENNQRLNKRVDYIFYIVIATLLSVIPTFLGVASLFLRR